MPDRALGPGGRMAVVAGIDALPADMGRLFVVVGVFDGLHLGHLYLLRRLCEEAARRDALPTVITFDHHPDEILTGAAPPLLCDPDERIARLEAAGVTVTIVQHFDVALRMTEFDDFIRRIAARSPLAGFLMTPESAFGHERRGTPSAVADLGRMMSFDVEVIPALELDGRPVRSGEIRAAIASGDLGGAATLLGRPYAVVGDARLGPGGMSDVRFPMPVAVPPTGAYPVTVEVDGADRRPGRAEVRPGGAVALAAEPHVSGRVRLVFE
ncbi:MAG TPA: hypothetical protein VFO50_06365 [Candidatus Limnocylindrales bacterium]|nr:hypothetical protein [Candidatus Limnocylindrales bacterium]